MLINQCRGGGPSLVLIRVGTGRSGAGRGRRGRGKPKPMPPIERSRTGYVEMSLIGLPLRAVGMPGIAPIGSGNEATPSANT